MSWRAAVIILLLLAVLPGCGDSEEDAGESRSPFFGIAPVDVPNESDFARMARGGVGSYRLVVAWPAIERSKGTYEWSTLDTVFADLARNGIAPIASVIGTPAAYAPETTIPPTSSDEAFDAWADFLDAAVLRYGPEGSFWQAFANVQPDVPPQPLRVWEIWNEPNSSVFWKPRPDPESYAALLKRSARVIENVDPEAEIMTGGMFATPQSDGAIVAYDFLDDLYSVPGTVEIIDSVGVHPYGPDVDAVTTQLDRTREAIDAAGDDATTWVTELGWGSDPDVPSDLAKTPEQQARLFSRSFTLMSEKRERWGLQGAIWFTWRDSDGPVGDCLWCETAGLVDSDRDSKPAWLAFTELTGGEP